MNSYVLSSPAFYLGALTVDYDFTRDIYGNVCAEFSMGHEALGNWLSEEVSDNQAVTRTIIDATDQLRSLERFEYTREGHEFDLEITRDEATIRAHSLRSNVDDDLPDAALDFYDQESIARCGLDDFTELMQSWLAFITRQ